jgi:spore maturation protein SpmB
MAQRGAGGKDPSDIFIPTLIATFAGIFVADRGCHQAAHQCFNSSAGLARRHVAIVLGIVWYFSKYMSKEEIQLVSKVAANFILLSVIVLFIVGALIKKVNVYEAFIEGAKGGIQTSLTIIPYLVGMLVAISVLRNSGVLGMLVSGMSWASPTGFQHRFHCRLPTALMNRSAAAARAMMIDAMKTYGVDSFVGRLVSILQGSSDTTFYIIALYFGSVGINKTRYAITYGLLADVAGVAAAIWVAYLFFH